MGRNDHMFNYPCVILCGGKSSRMGKDKALLPFGGYETLAEYQYARLKPHFPEIYLSCKDVSKFPFAECIEDESGESSPMVALMSSFHALMLPYLFFIPVDSPFVSVDAIEKIDRNLTCSKEIFVPEVNGKTHHLIGVYGMEVLPRIEEAVDSSQHKIGLILESAKTVLVPFESEEMFWNLNYPEEYEKALKKLL